MTFQSKRRSLKSVFLAVITAIPFAFVGLAGSQAPASALDNDVVDTDIKCVPYLENTNPIIIGSRVAEVYPCKFVIGIGGDGLWAYFTAGTCKDVDCGDGPVITMAEVDSAAQYVRGSLESDCVAILDASPQDSLVVSQQCQA